MSTQHFSTPYNWSSAAVAQLYAAALQDAKQANDLTAAAFLEILPKELEAIERRSRSQLQQDRLNTIDYLFPEPAGRPSPAAALAQFHPAKAKTILHQEHTWNAEWAGKVFQFSPVQETKILDVSPFFMLGNKLETIYLKPDQFTENPIDEVDDEPLSEADAFTTDQAWANATVATSTASNQPSFAALPSGGIWLGLSVPTELNSLDGLQLQFSGLTAGQSKLLSYMSCTLPGIEISIETPQTVWEKTPHSGPLDKESLLIHKLRTAALNSLANGLVRIKTAATIDQLQAQSDALPPAIKAKLMGFGDPNLVVLPFCLPAGLEAIDFSESTLSVNIVPVWNARRIHLEGKEQAPVELRLPTTGDEDIMEPFQLLGLERAYVQSPYQLLQPSTLRGCSQYTYRVFQREPTNNQMFKLKESIDTLIPFLTNEVARIHLGDEDPFQNRPTYENQGNYRNWETLSEKLKAASAELASITVSAHSPHFVEVSAAGKFYYLDYLVTQSSPIIHGLTGQWQLPLVLQPAKDEVKTPPTKAAFLVSCPAGGRAEFSLTERRAYVVQNLTLHSNATA